MKIHFPFRIKLYDEHGHEHESKPIWLEFDEPPDTPNECGWDWLAAIETEAAKVICADLQCSVDWDEFKNRDNLSVASAV